MSAPPPVAAARPAAGGDRPGAGAPGVSVGAVVAARTVRLTRTSLVRYAAAAGDFNPVHHSDHAARAAGMAGVLAHGMLTLGLAVELVTDWAGGPDTLVSVRVRFTRPLLVPDDGIGADLELAAVVSSLSEDGLVGVDLTARARSADADPVAVLGQARAVLRPRAGRGLAPGSTPTLLAQALTPAVAQSVPRSVAQSDALSEALSDPLRVDGPPR